MLDNLYQRLDKESLLAVLQPKDRGDNFLVTCPSCGKREAYVYKNGNSIHCSRKSKCGYEKHIKFYLMEEQGLTDFQAFDMIKQYAGMRDYKSTAEDLSYFRKRAQEAQDQLDLSAPLEKLKTQSIEWLWMDHNLFAREYLHGRGFTDDNIRSLEFGLFGAKDKMLPSFDEATRQALEEPLGSYHNAPACISIPIYSIERVLKGFTARSLGDGPRYLHTKGLDAEDFYNVHECLDQDQVYVVEGHMDALSFKAKGFSNVVAIGRNKVSKGALKNLTSYTPNVSFILCPDNDQAGEKGLQAMIHEILPKHEVYILPIPKEMDGKPLKDANDLMIALGDGFKDYVANGKTVKTLIDWYINNAMFKYGKEPKDLTALEIDQFLKDVWQQYTIFPDVKKAEFKERVRVAFEYESVSIIDTKFAQFQANETEVKRLAKAKEQVNTLQFALALPDPDDQKLIDVCGDLYENLKSQETDTRKKGSLLHAYLPEQLERDLQNTQIGFRTGYKALDLHATIPPNSLTIIGGRTGGGKTTFMINLLVNLLEKYSDHRVIFLSYEEANMGLAMRMINIMADNIISEDFKQKNFGALFHYMREKKDLNGMSIMAIDKAYQKYKDYVAEERLYIIDQDYNTEEIGWTLEEALEKHNDKIIIIADYLQKVPLSPQERDKNKTRQQEIQKVSQLLLSIAKSNTVPIIMGCQMRRPEKESKAHKVGETIDADYFENIIRLEGARESGDIEQDAHLFLGVSHSDQIKEKESPLDLIEERHASKGKKQPEVEASLRVDKKFYVKIIKNRYGESEKLITLDYCMPTMKISDPIEMAPVNMEVLDVWKA